MLFLCIVSYPFMGFYYPALTLLVYTPANAAMRGCHVYDLENGEAKHVMQGVYDSVNGMPSRGSE